MCFWGKRNGIVSAMLGDREDDGVVEWCVSQLGKSTEAAQALEK
jgi:hypothetical protein